MQLLWLLQGNLSRAAIGGERDAASRAVNLPSVGRAPSCDCPTPPGCGKAEITPWHYSSWRRTRSRRTGQEGIILDLAALAPHTSVTPFYLLPM